MLSKIQSEKIKKAFIKGTLLTQSINSIGFVEWMPVRCVHRADTENETIWQVTTVYGEAVVTGRHRIYVNYTDACSIDAVNGLVVGNLVLSDHGQTPIFNLQKLEPRKYMYDLTVEKNHNLLLENSKLWVHNCPDKFYHFRPPEYEGDIGQYNRIFGQVWEDAELLEYLNRAVDWWNMFPPFTGHNTPTLERLVTDMPAWRTAILWCAISHACFALAANWTVDEFDYSIGGVSLTIEKSSKYESLKQNAEGQFDKATEAKARTVKFIRGLVQPRFGIGVRSAFGPNVGRGVLSPRSFI